MNRRKLPAARPVAYSLPTRPVSRHHCPYCLHALGPTALDFDRPRDSHWRLQLHCKRCGGHLKPSGHLKWLAGMAIVGVPLALAATLWLALPIIYVWLAVLAVSARWLWRGARFDKTPYTDGKGGQKP